MIITYQTFLNRNNLNYPKKRGKAKVMVFHSKPIERKNRDIFRFLRKNGFIDLTSEERLSYYVDENRNPISNRKLVENFMEDTGGLGNFELIVYIPYKSRIKVYGRLKSNI